MGSWVIGWNRDHWGGIRVHRGAFRDQRGGIRVQGKENRILLFTRNGNLPLEMSVLHVFMKRLWINLTHLILTYDSSFSLVIAGHRF